MKIAFPASAPDHSNPIKNKYLIGNYLIDYFEKFGNQVEVFPVKENLLLNYLQKTKKAFYKLFTNKNYLRQRSMKYLKYLTNQINPQINASDVDFVFSFGSMPLAFLEVKKPMYFLTDATFQNLINFYDEYTNLSKVTLKNSNEVEKLAFKKARKIFFSSEWAAQSAISDYNLPENKVEVVYLGGNLDFVPQTSEIISKLEGKDFFKTINLLSIGKGWYRKGHDRTVEVLNGLLQKKINATLTIIGEKVPNNWDSYSPFLRSKITVYDVLKKEIPRERKIIEDAFSRSHFLLLLSRFETFGHVIAEANAFGVPVIASNIGGIPSAVKNGVNGFLINNSDIPSEIIDRIISLSSNPETYKRHSLLSKQEYENRLNWNCVVQKILTSIQNDLNK